MARQKMQSPHSHWATEYQRVVSDDGRIGYFPRNDATMPTFVEFFANLGTAILLMYWASVGGLLPAFLDNFFFGVLSVVAIMFWQHESVTRWPLRCVVWAIFWGMWYFNLHWVPLF